MLTPAQVIEVLTDHQLLPGITGVHVCGCGQTFFAPAEYVAHCAVAVCAIDTPAVAVPPQQRRRLVPVTELGDDRHHGCDTVLPVLGVGDVTGILMGARRVGDPYPLMEVDVLEDEALPVRTVLVGLRSWAEVARQPTP